MTQYPPQWEAMKRRLSSETDRPHVAWQWYVDGVERPAHDLVTAIEAARAGEGFIWCGMRDPDDHTMETFQQLFGLHELAVEDAVEGHDRSKLEVFDDTLFMVVNTVDYVEHTEVTAQAEIVSTGQVMIYLGSWFVMTSRKGGRPFMNDIRRVIEADPEGLAMGPWRVLYQVLDHIVDDFSQTVVEMENDVEEVEAAVFSPTGRGEIDRPYQLKRELIEFKRAIFPLSRPLLALQTQVFRPIPEEARAYFREVSDHLVAARESVVALDEVLTTILHAAIARASFADGQDMRRISAAVAILAVPTTLGAVYGMNFDNMPELHMEYGYYVVLAFMVVSMIVLTLVFRRIKWL